MSYVVERMWQKIPYFKILGLLSFLLAAFRFLPYPHIYDLGLPKEILFQHSQYFLAKTWVVKCLSFTGLLALLFFREPKYECPDVIEKEDLKIIERNVSRLQKRGLILGQKPEKRNDIFLGYDVFSQKPFFLEGEGIFTGVLVLGRPGTGKTARTYKTMMNQLLDDEKTAGIFFTLKGQDKTYVTDLLKKLGKQTIALEDMQLLDLCQDPELGFRKDNASALIAAGVEGAGLGTNDNFWVLAGASELSKTLSEMGELQRSLSGAIQMMKRGAEETGNRTALSYIETLKPALEELEGVNGSALRFGRKPGFCKGPIWVRPGEEARLYKGGENLIAKAGDEPLFLPALTQKDAFYEIGYGVDLGIDFSEMKRGASFVLPVWKETLGNKFGITFLKQGFVKWFYDQMNKTEGGSLSTDPLDRFRYCLFCDEGHNYLSKNAMGVSDQKLLGEGRQGGLGYLFCTQTTGPLKKANLLSSFNTVISYKVAPGEMPDVQKLMGKSEKTRGRVSFSEPKKMGEKVQVSQSHDPGEAFFLSESLWKKLPEGVAVVIPPDGKTRLIFCPYADNIQFEVGHD